MIESLGIEGVKRRLEFAVNAFDYVVRDVALSLEITSEAGGQRRIENDGGDVCVSVGAKKSECLATIGREIVSAVENKRQPARLRDQLVDAISDLGPLTLNGSIAVKFFADGVATDDDRILRLGEFGSEGGLARPRGTDEDVCFHHWHCEGTWP